MEIAKWNMILWPKPKLLSTSRPRPEGEQGVGQKSGRRRPMAMCWANDFLVVSQLKTLVVVVAAEIICNATFGIIHAQIACDSRKILQHSTANFTIMRLQSIQKIIKNKNSFRCE